MDGSPPLYVQVCEAFKTRLGLASESTGKEKKTRASKTAPRLKVLGAKPDDLSSISGTRVAEGEQDFL